MLARHQKPSSVAAGTTFTVQVAVTTDESMSTVAKSDPMRFEGRHHARHLFGPGESFDSMTVNAKGGIATFSLNLSTPGDYDLSVRTVGTPQLRRRRGRELPGLR